MRTLVLFFFLILIVNFKVFSQTDDSSILMIDGFQELPMFPGGNDSIWCFLEHNFNYEILNSNQNKVRYNVIFVIDTTGQAINFRITNTTPRDIIRDNADSLRRIEVFRVLGLMPKWTPAKQLNEKISCWFYIPIQTPYTEFKCKRKNKKNSH